MNTKEYFSNLTEDRKKPLKQLRKMIKETFPGIKETMDYKMPTYVLDGQTICAVASQKNHMALYVMSYDSLKKFEEELKPFDCGKSCIRFKKLDSDTLRLFQHILKHAGKKKPRHSYYIKTKE